MKMFKYNYCNIKSAKKMFKYNYCNIKSPMKMFKYNCCNPKSAMKMLQVDECVDVNMYCTCVFDYMTLCTRMH